MSDGVMSPAGFPSARRTAARRYGSGMLTTVLAALSRFADLYSTNIPAGDKGAIAGDGSREVIVTDIRARRSSISSITGPPFFPAHCFGPELRFLKSSCRVRAIFFFIARSNATNIIDTFTAVVPVPWDHIARSCFTLHSCIKCTQDDQEVRRMIANQALGPPGEKLRSAARGLS